MANDRLVLLRTTMPDDAKARILARRLVDDRLAACVHRYPVASTYTWHDAVHEESEVVVEARVTPANAAAARKRILALHPYEVPLIEQLEVSGVPPAYMDWAVAASTKGG